ncbi:MAG TPA: SDH family Clp fold serine proteinase [Candidatus Wunengus sp. YC63]|uniref:SDH family Clp fold serine proteinase n=1 Tax=Candidatus Wunengus sp. YC63 TaxID=3367699 RepID=UPI002713753F|nr:ATP-dependent Clp protease proteolytic subunit [Candidatus Brocadiales bacterium]
MGFINEYIDRRLCGPELESELLKLISEYNEKRDTYLFVYAAAIGKPIPALPLEQADFYVIRDLLASKKDIQMIDMYIETPGGSGETAEEIVKFLRNNFDTVSFVVSGEAKSAGTIIVLSGDEILMTETGSLGPIDAQMKIGRSVVSAYDYMEWVEEKRKEAEEQGRLNPFDATMVAQITPGELGSVFHALKFAEDLVVEWLINYKFKKWAATESRKIPVTEEMKRKRAGEIAKELTNHSKWRLHGRSIKIDDLEEIGLKITRIDGNPKLAEIVYRIQTVCRLLFDTTSFFKIFATQDNKIFRQAVPVGAPIRIPEKPTVDIAEIEQKCPKCGETYKLYAKFVHNPKIDVDFKNKGFIPFPKDAKIICKCGFEIDLLGIKNQIEIQTGRKVIVE